jgi:hypothetical protein
MHLPVHIAAHLAVFLVIDWMTSGPEEGHRSGATPSNLNNEIGSWIYFPPESLSIFASTSRLGNDIKGW